jgi:hypothetical protein
MLKEIKKVEPKAIRIFLKKVKLVELDEPESLKKPKVNKNHQRFAPLMPLDDIKTYLMNTKIKCFKYNYAFGDDV